MNLNREINLNKKLIVSLILINVIALSLYYSYALFEANVIKNDVVVIKAANVSCSYETNLTNNTVSIPSGESRNVTITLTGENQERGYKLWYIATGNPNIEVTSDNGIGEGTFTSSKIINLTITNKGSSSITLTIGANFGWKEYEVVLENNQNPINITVWAANVSYSPALLPEGVKCEGEVTCNDTQLILDKIADMLK